MLELDEVHLPGLPLGLKLGLRTRSKPLYQVGLRVGDTL